MFHLGRKVAPLSKALHRIAPPQPPRRHFSKSWALANADGRIEARARRS